MFCHLASISDRKGIRCGGIALALARILVPCTILFGKMLGHLVDLILGVVCKECCASCVLTFSSWCFLNL